MSAKRKQPRHRKRTGRRVGRSALVRRWLAVVALGVSAFLYYRPVVTYLERRGEVARAGAEVRALETERKALERRLGAQTSTASLLREARRLGYVKPGERLFIVKGIPQWRRAREVAAKNDRTTIGGDG